MKFTFTASEMTCNGKTFPVEYSVTPAGTVFVFARLDNGEQTRIRFNPDHADYPAALAAARGEAEKPAADPADAAENIPAADAEKPAADPAADSIPAAAPDAEPLPAADPADAAENIPAADPADAEKPAAEVVDDPKKAHGPIPEKWWIGQEIKGRGWTIEANGSLERIRVIFKKTPTDKARELVKAAGFYWSPSMKSWNRKTTHKAWRAAEKLSFELKAIAAV